MNSKSAIGLTIVGLLATGMTLGGGAGAFAATSSPIDGGDSQTAASLEEQDDVTSSLGTLRMDVGNDAGNELAGTLDGETPDVSSSKNATASAAPSSKDIPSAEWAACGVFDDASKLVHSYDRQFQPNSTMQNSVAALRCGNDSYGYRHIQNGQQTDWEAMSAPVNRNWRDLAGWGISWALYSPDSVTYRDNNDT